jgi:hypothetical protein
VKGLFIWHCHLKGHLSKMGLTISPTCKRCLEKMNQPHMSYVIVRLQLTTMEPAYCQNTPLSKILHIISSAELLKSLNRLQMVIMQGPVKVYPLFIHSSVYSFILGLLFSEGGC